jgi:uncharacterized membrane protein YphA (DoxX/SURF4 family)
MYYVALMTFILIFFICNNNSVVQVMEKDGYYMFLTIFGGGCLWVWLGNGKFSLKR